MFYTQVHVLLKITHKIGHIHEQLILCQGDYAKQHNVILLFLLLEILIDKREKKLTKEKSHYYFEMQFG